MNSNPLVWKQKPRVTRLKARVRRLKTRVKRLKTQVNIIKPLFKRKNSELKNIVFQYFTASSETTLATKEKFFFTKVAPVESIADIALLGFSLIPLPGKFVSYYTIIYFFINNFFSNVSISVNAIFECSCLSFGWEIGHSLSMYVIRGIEVGHPKCLQMRTGVVGYQASYVRTPFHCFFLCFCHMVSCFICRNLALPSLRNSVFVRNSYFSPMRSISVVTE